MLGRAFGRLVDADAVERDPALAGTGDVVVADGPIFEPALRQPVHLVGAFAGVEHVGEQQDVVGGRDFDVVERQHQPGEFEVVADLEDGRIFKQRAQRVERGIDRDLIGQGIGTKQRAVARGLAVRERHVAGFVGLDREREADELALHGIEARRLDLDGRKPGRGRALDPALQAIEAPYRLVLRSIDLGVARGFGARGGERLGDRHELFPSPLGGGRAAGEAGRAGGGA